MATEAQTLTFLALLLPFAGAAVAPTLTRLLGHNAAWLLALVPALLLAHFAGFLPVVADGGVVTGAVAWAPSLGVDLSWRVDGLSLTFALLISGIGDADRALFGRLPQRAMRGRAASSPSCCMFMGAMQGLVLSDGFMTLFVFWELTSITSFLLIGFDNQREAARRAAFQALVVTGLGGLSLLAGLLIIWNVTGAAGMSALLGQGACLRDSPLYLVALVLVLGGAFTKSAQFPFHFWLPNAMAGADAGLGLSAFGDHGEGRRLSADAAQSGDGRHGRLGDGAAAVRRRDAARRHRAGDAPDRPQADAGLYDGGFARLAGHADRLRFGRAIEAAVLYLVAHSMFKGALFMVAGADRPRGTGRATSPSSPVWPRHAGQFCGGLAGRRSRWPGCRCSSASSPRKRSTRARLCRRAGRCPDGRRDCRQRA